VTLQEIYKPDGFLLLSEVKVHAVPECHDVEAVRVRVMLQQQLLEIVERSLMGDPLPDLNHCMPRASREVLLTVFALLIPHSELH
jgi:hypothetical protein